MKTRSDHFTVPRKWLRHGLLLVLVFAAIISLVAAWYPTPEQLVSSGWVLVEKVLSSKIPLPNFSRGLRGHGTHFCWKLFLIL